MTQDIVYRTVPFHPLTILTPPIYQEPPSQKALLLIEGAVRRICADDMNYSVTFSPVVCPTDKRALYILRPFVWQKEDGSWEHRNGQRNPGMRVPGSQRIIISCVDCALPQGPAQLETMSEAIRNLALGFRYLSDEKLRPFFVDEKTQMLPQVECAQVHPGEVGAKGNASFVFSVRFLILVTQHVPLLDLDKGLEGELKKWFQAHVDFMQSSEQGKAAAANDDNRSMWYKAILASHLTYLDPPQGSPMARKLLGSPSDFLESPERFVEQIWGSPYRRHAALFLLEPIFLLAALAELPPRQLRYLQALVDRARIIPNDTVDIHSDNDERYAHKLGLFERLLAVMKGKDVDAAPAMHGDGWEGGWGEYMTITWKLLG